MGSTFDYTYSERTNRDINAGLYERFFLENPAGAAEFTLGAEAANKRIVTVQLQDIGGVDLAEMLGVEVFLASDAVGTLTAANDDFAVESGQGQALGEPVTNSVLSVLSKADGSFQVGITDTSGAASYWLGVKFPGGRIVMSGEIAFAA